MGMCIFFGELSNVCRLVLVSYIGTYDDAKI